MSRRRPNPAENQPETPEIAENPASRRHIAALMRINHSGEVAAQALYQGQAFVSRADATRASLMEAAREETDHLAWCADRIRQLGGRTSVLNPLWYAGSFTIGALAGLAGDKVSLGFVAETERQVVEHLDGHLQRLPAEDVAHARHHPANERRRRDDMGAMLNWPVLPTCRGRCGR